MGSSAAMVVVGLRRGIPAKFNHYRPQKVDGCREKDPGRGHVVTFLRAVYPEACRWSDPGKRERPGAIPFQPRRLEGRKYDKPT